MGNGTLARGTLPLWEEGKDEEAWTMARVLAELSASPEAAGLLPAWEPVPEDGLDLPAFQRATRPFAGSGTVLSAIRDEEFGVVFWELRDGPIR